MNKFKLSLWFNENALLFDAKDLLGKDLSVEDLLAIEGVIRHLTSKYFYMPISDVLMSSIISELYDDINSQLALNQSSVLTRCIEVSRKRIYLI